MSICGEIENTQREIKEVYVSINNFPNQNLTGKSHGNHKKNY